MKLLIVVGKILSAFTSVGMECLSIFAYRSTSQGWKWHSNN